MMSVTNIAPFHLQISFKVMNAITVLKAFKLFAGKPTEMAP